MKIKKIIMCLYLISATVSLSKMMDEDVDKYYFENGHHHMEHMGKMMKKDKDKYYFKKRHHHMEHMGEMMGNDLTDEQKKELMDLRKEMMRSEKGINSKLHKLRGEMNKCMRDERKDNERFSNFHKEKRELLKEREDLRREYKVKYKEILKKQ